MSEDSTSHSAIILFQSIELVNIIYLIFSISLHFDIVSNYCKLTCHIIVGFHLSKADCFCSLKVRLGFSHHNVDLAAGTCADDKPLVFVLDAKNNKPKEEEERPRKKSKKDHKSKKNAKTKVV